MDKPQYIYGVVTMAQYSDRPMIARARVRDVAGGVAQIDDEPSMLTRYQNVVRVGDFDATPEAAVERWHQELRVRLELLRKEREKLEAMIVSPIQKTWVL